jgi:hypothetical protein
MITYKNGKYQYFDRNGTEITVNSKIQYPDGSIETVYLTENDELGIDATNKSWIESGRAVPCEYGIYPLNCIETNEVEVVL